uniref:Uncharacterized protein n=1 Tax=Physcomitrium patens TaxID=3218 RepID=A0A2K1L2H8_PHYPA|nr:hypothetical protein PHYPA_003025 [Physcomitrium patens]
MKARSRGIYSSSSTEGLACTPSHSELLTVVKLEATAAVLANKASWLGSVRAAEAKS